jgi:4a-hydroxytetrahydrobiopterin dehydratase
LPRARPPLIEAGVGFADRHCARWPKGTPPLAGPAVAAALRELPGWTGGENDTRLTRRYTFADFRAAMRFVGALADLANAEDHHPDFTVRWNLVEVTSWTHDAGGLTDNDFILAARLDALAEPRLP